MCLGRSDRESHAIGKLFQKLNRDGCSREVKNEDDEAGSTLTLGDLRLSEPG